MLLFCQLIGQHSRHCIISGASTKQILNCGFEGPRFGISEYHGCALVLHS